MDEETSLENWEVGAEPARGFESYLPRQKVFNLDEVLWKLFVCIVKKLNLRKLRHIFILMQ